MWAWRVGIANRLDQLRVHTVDSPNKAADGATKALAHTRATDRERDVVRRWLAYDSKVHIYSAKILQYYQ